MSFIKKYFEGILVTAALLSVVLAYGQVAPAPLMMIMCMLLLSFYYLLSAMLVLFDRRVSRAMRLIFIVGLYVISIGLVGSLFKLHLWHGSEMIMILAMSSGAAVLVVMAVYYWLNRTDLSKTGQLGILAKRVVPFMAIFAFIFMLDYSTIFDNFDEHRHDQRYKELKLRSLADPANAALTDSVHLYRQKHFQNDDPTSPEDH